MKIHIKSLDSRLRGNDSSVIKKYCIVTFGCAQNQADSERIAASFEGRGYTKVDDWKNANTIVINTCVVRQMAEDRVYGLVRNISRYFSTSVNQYISKSVRQYDGKVVNEKHGNTDTRNNTRGAEKRIRVNLQEIRVDPGDEKKVKGELGENMGVIKGGIMPKIIVTGCMVGMAARDKTGKILARLKERMPEVDEFLPIEEVGFNLEPVRQNQEQGLVVISNGCNNFCTFCVVPFSRGREVSRPFEDIVEECKKLKEQGYKSVMLLGQNVNSYGADIVKNQKSRPQDFKKDPSVSKKPQDDVSVNLKKIQKENQSLAMEQWNNGTMKPVMVKHLGRYRIPTLFPHLLDAVASLGFEKVDFMSSNPWDFSDELIDVIARNKNITRQIHLPVQSGSDDVLKRMNRWYIAKEYIKLVEKLRKKVNEENIKRHSEGSGSSRRLKNLPDQGKKILRYAQDDDGSDVLKITTDIIVGFCGETDEEFQQTVDLCKKIKFEKAYVSIYSSRPMTGATIAMKDDVPYATKKKRWEKLDKLINHKNIK